MKMSGEYTLNAGREAVWEALNDAEVLKKCIPGCESIDKLSDTEMEAVATAKVGPVKAKFKGKVQLSDLDPPNGYTISGEGSGGAAGFAKGAAKVALAEADGGGTVLSYDVDATVGGKLAQIGQRLIDGAAKKMADSFFTAFADHFGGAEPDAGEADAAEADAAGGDEEDPLIDVAPAMSKEMHAQFEEERFKSKQLIYGGLVVIAVLGVLSLLW